MRSAPLFLAALLTLAPAKAWSVLWVSGNSMARGRYQATVTPLPNGLVLVAGGVDTFGSPLSGTELYNPIANGWTEGAPMSRFRYLHTATLLANGKVLVAGGTDGIAPLYTCELYDPATNTWSPAGSLSVARYRHSATWIASTGKVLVTGGFSGGGTASVEEYDPSTNLWTIKTSMGIPRYDHTAILLRDQVSVLVAGGFDNNTPASPRTTAERWNGASWSATANNMPNAHAQATAGLLPNGTVVVAGGVLDNAGNSSKNAEIYTPGSNAWSAGAALPQPRTLNAGVMNSLGQVLMIGGFAANFTDSFLPEGAASSYVQDPPQVPPVSTLNVSDNCTISCNSKSPNCAWGIPPGPLNPACTLSPCANEGAACSAAGVATVCVSTNPTDTTVICSDTRYNHTFTASPLTNRAYNLAIQSDIKATGQPISGTILVDDITLTSHKIFMADGSTVAMTVGTGKLPVRTNIVQGRLSDTVTLSGVTVSTFQPTVDFCNAATAICPKTIQLVGDSLVIAGTLQVDQMVFSDTLVYDPANTWSFMRQKPASPTHVLLAASQFFNSSTVLPAGQALVLGGIDDQGNARTSLEILVNDIGAFTAAAAPNARQFHSATLLTSGNILVAGGDNGNTPPSSPIAGFQVYDPSASGFAAAGASMNSSRESHTATLLPDGRVLACGGYTGADWTAGVVHSTSTCELYTPGSNSFAYTVAMTTPRAHHTATLLFTGQVLVTGGVDQNGTPLSRTEIYDVFLTTWFQITPLNVARSQHTSTLLRDGRVLIAGGRQLNPLGISEVYDPSSTLWTPAQMSRNRYLHTATFLPDGRVVAAGGLDIFGFPMRATEVYDPQANSWSASSDMRSEHAGHTGTLLPNGKVLVTGGATLFDKNSSTRTVETYEGIGWKGEVEAADGDHTMTALRARHTATLLNNGKILLVGGWSGSAALATAEAAYFSDLSPVAAFQPTIASVSPTSGPPGSVITITGNQLSGVSEASAGLNYAHSAVNNPRLILRPFDSGNAGTQAGSSFILDASTSIYSDPTPMSITNPDSGGPDSYRFTVPQTGCGNYQLASLASGLVSAFTQFKVQPLPVVSSPTVTGQALSATTIRFSFPVTNASNYYVYPATAPGTIVVWTSSANVTYQNLSTNTAVGIVARAENCISSSTLSKSVTIYTLASQPGTPLVTAVSSFSVTLNWNANQNPAGTSYTVSYSSQGVPGLGSECSLPALCQPVVATTLQVKGLNPGTTWEFQVRADNGDGVASEFSGRTAAVTLPDRPTDVQGTALGISSVTWSWVGLAWATSYKVYSAAAAQLTLLGSTTTVSFIQTGLSPNSLAAIRVSGVQGASEGPLSVTTATAYSLAAPPTPSVTGVTSLTADLAWAANGNPAGTLYSISYSTDNFISSQVNFLQFSQEYAGTTQTVTGLTPNVTYFFSMRAQNFSGIASALSVVVSTRTDIEIPANILGTALGNSSVSWTWTAVPYAEIYDVFLATKPSQFLGSTLGTSTTFYHSGLGVNRPSQIVARARNVTLSITGPLSPASGVVYTLAETPGTPQVVAVSSLTATVTWAANGNPPTTAYVVETATNTLFNEGRIPDLSTTNVSNVRLTGLLPRTTYYIRVYAANGSNVPTLASGTTQALTTLGGVIEKIIPRGADTLVEAVMNSNRVVTLLVPKGSFSDATFLVVQDSTYAPCGGIPAAVSITVSPAQQPTEVLQLTVSYHATDVVGVDQARLVLSRLDETTGRCAPLTSRVDISASTRAVTALIDHLSLYQIMLSTPGTRLSDVEVFPNPLRPSQAGQSLMTFRSLPAGAKVQLFTLRGELVWETAADASGSARWPGTNQSGRRVASGVYLVLLKQGSSTKMIKVAVER